MFCSQPVVLTMYCEYEGVKMGHIFKWPELEFSTEALGKCDDEVRRAVRVPYAPKKKRK